MTVTIETGNITTASTDAIVNAANSSLQRGGGVCGAIFDAVNTASGRDAYSELTNACFAIGHCNTGDAVITPSFGLNASFIIHAVGPIWSGDSSPADHLDNEQTAHVSELASTYRAIIRVCRENKLSSVTIPAISTGIFGFPTELAAAIAKKVCSDEADDIAITLVGFNEDATQTLREAPTESASRLLKNASF
jgi:O-acetyl-ADP-ribose deacetylase (regulator of RNase III)